MKQRMFKSKFTLVELLVSMGVFSILLVLFMQFFSGTQKIWSSGEKNNVLDARARAVLNTLSTFIQCIYYSSGNPAADNGHKDSFFFRVDKGGVNDALYCAIKARTELPGNNVIRFISVQLPQKNDTKYGSSYSSYYGQLMVTVLCDDSTADEKAAEYARFFPEYRSNSSTYPVYTYGGAQAAYEQAFADLITILDQKIYSSDAKAENCRFALAKNVAGFNIEIGNIAANGTFNALTATANTNINARSAIDIEPTKKYKGISPLPLVPEKLALKITLNLLSDLDYERWIALNTAATESGAAKKFREENQKTYSRLIYLGDRWTQQE